MWAKPTAKPAWIQKSYMIKPLQCYKLSGAWNSPSVYCVQYQWFHCLKICCAYCFLFFSLTTKGMTPRIVDSGESLLVAGSPFNVILNEFPCMAKKGFLRLWDLLYAKPFRVWTTYIRSSRCQAAQSTAWPVHLLCALSLVALSVDSAAKMSPPPTIKKSLHYSDNLKIGPTPRPWWFNVLVVVLL